MDFSRQLQLLPQSASSLSSQVDHLALLLTVLSVFITMVVFVLVVYFALRYRRRTEDEVPPETVSAPWFEVSWCIVIFVAFLCVFGWGAKLYVLEKRPMEHGLEIHVIGKQWMWKVQHPGGQREINELHVPVGQPVKLIMTSEDVIHSFGIPAFRITQDVVPGSYSTQWFTATRPGDYLLECREYCGPMHSQMIGRVIVMQPPAYQAWLAGTLPDESAAESGSKLFTAFGCAQCHGRAAPTLAGLYGSQVTLDTGGVVTADENYLRESILNPPARVVAGYARAMPSYRGQLSEEQLSQLIEFIKSIAATHTGATARTDTAGPATLPTGFPPQRLPDYPPARSAPDSGPRAAEGSPQ